MATNVQVDNTTELANEEEALPDQSDQEINESATLYSNHGTKEVLEVKKGKLKGKNIVHFKCAYWVLMLL